MTATDRYAGTRYSNAGNPSLLAMLPDDARVILDVGCGAGDNARLLSGRTIYGVTASAAEATLARPACADVWVADVESSSLPLGDNAVDAILLSHVVEHFVAPAATLARLARHLRPRGLLLIAVPNMAHWRLRVRLAAGDWHRDDGGAFDRTHLHFWSWQTATAILDGTPYELVELRGADFAVPLRPLRRLAPSLAARVDVIAGTHFPNLFATQILLSARAR